MILPAGVLTGVAVGGSCSIGVLFELPDESPVVQQMFKNRKRAAIVSTTISIGVGVFCGPVAGVISEMITYPTSLLKVRKVNNYLKKDYKIKHKKLTEAKSVNYSKSTIQGIFA